MYRYIIPALLITSAYIAPAQAQCISCAQADIANAIQTLEQAQQNTQAYLAMQQQDILQQQRDIQNQLDQIHMQQLLQQSE